MPKLTRNPNRAKLSQARLAQRSSVKWSKVERRNMRGKTAAARAAGRERQQAAFIAAAQSWYAMQNGGTLV